MDALAQLALMTKAKLLFETPTTFLSFPALTPISYAPENLNFAAASTSAQMSAFADFSRWTNQLPQGTILQFSESMLWDMYMGILQNAEVAQGSLTDAQSATLAAAQEYLYTSGPDGLNVDTPVMITYRQYQQAYFTAVQSYNNLQVTATNSADAQVKAAWQNGGAAAAQAALASAESDWENLGYKTPVEQAQLTEQTLGAQSPQLKWGQWQKQCDPNLDFPSDPGSNSAFGATLFEPFDVLENTAWPSFTIAGADIPNLVAQAPPELKSLFTSDAGTSVIKSVSFEFCSVAVERPWFSQDVFSAQFWRFRDASVQISDGADPPTGTWPAFVNAVVFARNITVVTETTTPAPPVQTFQPIPVTILKPVQPPVVRPLPISIQPRFPPHPIYPGGGNGGIRPVIHPGPHPVMMAMGVRPVLPIAQPPVQATATDQPTPGRPDLMLDEPVRQRLMMLNFNQIHSPPVAPTPNTPSTTTTSTQCTSSGAAVSILAFICKRIPLCPNPDLSLQWS